MIPYDDRFTRPHQLLDFYASSGVLIFDALFLLFMAVDLAIAWRGSHLLLRVGMTAFLAGVTVFRLYITWAIWNYAAGVFPLYRFYADLAVVVLNLIFGFCWFVDRRTERN